MIVFSHTHCFMFLKTHFSTIAHSAFLKICSLLVLPSVDQKVNTCWPKFFIWKYTLSAFCSYLYSFQNPSGGSEPIVTVKKVQKRCKPMKITPPGRSIARYIAQLSKANIRSTRIYTFFGVFSPLPTFLSPQMGSGDYKNSQRKLRVCTLGP